jgi:hypothetical protein
MTDDDRAQLSARLAAMWRSIALGGLAALDEANGMLAERDVTEWERELAAVPAAVGTWVSAALELADETLRELRATELAGPGAAPERRPEYWVGRLEGALAGLAEAVRGELR